MDYMWELIYLFWTRCSQLPENEPHIVVKAQTFHISKITIPKTLITFVKENNKFQLLTPKANKSLYI